MIQPLSQEESDFIRCAINRMIRAGFSSMRVSPEIWREYRKELETIREKLRLSNDSDEYSMELQAEERLSGRQYS